MLKKIIVGIFLLLGLGAVIFYIWPQPKYQAGQPSEVFIEQAKTFYVPDLPPDWVFHDFMTEDGRRIRWGETGNRDAAKATLILVPGFSGFMEMYGEQVDMLAERGFHVVGFEARGMGGGDRDNANQPEQMNPKDFKTYSDDFASFYNQNIAPIPNDKAILALSFGAHFSLRAVGEHKLDLDAVVAAAPALRLQTGSELSYAQAIKGLSLLRTLGRGEYFLPGMGNWLPYSDDLTAVKECGSMPERLYRRDVILADRLDLRTGGPTVNWVLEIDESGRDYMMSAAFKTNYKVPTAFLLADKDTIIENDYAEGICNDLETCSVSYLSDAGHCLLVERDEILIKIYDEVDRLLGK